MPVAMANAFALLLHSWKLPHVVRSWPLQAHPPLQVHLRQPLKLLPTLMPNPVMLLRGMLRPSPRLRLLRWHHRNQPSPWSRCAETTVLVLGKSSQLHLLAAANLVIAAKAAQAIDRAAPPRVVLGETRVAQVVPVGLVIGVVGSTTVPSAGHAWETRPSVPSATPWSTRRLNCASWLHKHTVKR